MNGKANAGGSNEGGKKGKMRLMLDKLPLPIQKILKNEPVALALGVAWTVGPLVFTALGFYMGTVLGSDHVIDLQSKDIANGGKGALIGLLVSIAVAITVTIRYPKSVEQDAAEANDHH